MSRTQSQRRMASSRSSGLAEHEAHLYRRYSRRRAALASREVPFIGVAKKNHLRRAELIRLFEAEGAAAVIENVNEIEGAIAKILNGAAE